MQIKQYYKGKERVYHAHKAILASGSRFFHKAFTCNFKVRVKQSTDDLTLIKGYQESSDNRMRVYDDIPEYFELALKFLYTNELDTEAIAGLGASGDPTKRVNLWMKIYHVAKKYDIRNLRSMVSDNIEVTLSTVSTIKATADIVKSCYEEIEVPDTYLGRCIAGVVLEKRKRFLPSADVTILIKTFPLFGTDLAIELSRQRKLGT